MQRGLVTEDVGAMRWAQVLALLPYMGLVVIGWVQGGVATGILFLVCFLFLILALRPVEAGGAIRGWAESVSRRRAPGASPSSSGDEQ